MIFKRFHAETAPQCPDGRGRRKTRLGNAVHSTSHSNCFCRPVAKQTNILVDFRASTEERESTRFRPFAKTSNHFRLSFNLNRNRRFHRTLFRRKRPRNREQIPQQKNNKTDPPPISLAVVYAVPTAAVYYKSSISCRRPYMNAAAIRRRYRFLGQITDTGGRLSVINITRFQ